MSSSQKIYRAEAMEYLEEQGVVCHGLWRDLIRYDLKYTREHMASWVTIDVLDELVRLYFEKKENDTRGKKLDDFAPNVADSWRIMCTLAERKRKLRVNIAHIRNRR
jgi:hypothetical protein